MAVLEKRKSYLFEEGDFAFSNVKGSSGIGIQNSERNIIEHISGSVEISVVSGNKTDNSDLNFAFVSWFLRLSILS